MHKIAPLIIAFLMLCMFSTLAHAEFVPQYRRDFKKSRPWIISIAPGYGFLNVKGDSQIRQGFQVRLNLGYQISENWGVQLKGQQGIFDGDKSGTEGIYSQSSVLFGGRYTFTVNDWFKPYLFFDLGWARTELNREIATLYSTHSMMIQPGGGLAFKVTPSFYMGLELSVAPILMGRKEIANSFNFGSLLLFDLRL